MKKLKRIASIIGIILIASMYLISLISAIFVKESSMTQGLFLASVFSTVVVPIMIYAFIETYKWVHRDDPKNTDEMDK